MKYNFSKIDETVKIVPMGALFCKRIMDRLRKKCKGVIMPNQCFFNALVVAGWLREWGFDVEVVEGMQSQNDNYIALSRKLGLKEESDREHLKNQAPIAHRWLRKGDKYFDPTVELLFGMEFVRSFDYNAKRIYDNQELIRYAGEIRDTFGVDEVHFVSSITGTTFYYDGDNDIPVHWGYINDDGEYVAPEQNPYELFTALRNTRYPSIS